MNELERSLRQTLRNSEQLDSETQASLVLLRKQALRATPKRRHAFLAPALGMTAAAVVAIVLLYSGSGDNLAPQQEDYLSGNVELYEDLDFYSWLAAGASSMEG